LKKNSFQYQYKFGVLYRKQGQSNEIDMYLNNDISYDFEEFLNLLGEKIELNGWKKYNAGLCTSSECLDGIYSYYTEFRNDYQIMFHVAPLLFFDEKDNQQIGRKRHLGNNVVIIIFDESNAPFDPHIMSSQFNHVFFLIRKVPMSNPTRYRIQVSNKLGVGIHEPILNNSQIYEVNQNFRGFLLTKLINSERASYQAKGFSSAFNLVRRGLLEEMKTKFYPPENVITKIVNM